MDFFPHFHWQGAHHVTCSCAIVTKLALCGRSCVTWKIAIASPSCQRVSWHHYLIKRTAVILRKQQSCFKRIHQSQSSIRSYASQTSLSTKRKMSETSESLNNKKTVTTIAATSSVGHSELPVAWEYTRATFTVSQEEYILNELSIKQFNTQLTVNNFYILKWTFRDCVKANS